MVTPNPDRIFFFDFKKKLKWLDKHSTIAQHNMPSTSQRRLSSFRQSFRPYFAQQTDAERDRLYKLRGPQRVCFSWAVRHAVSSRATEDDVAEGRASYLGQAMSFDKNTQLAAPTMTFDSGRNYCIWRECQSLMAQQPRNETPSHALAPEEIDDVPDWMLDMESEQHARFN